LGFRQNWKHAGLEFNLFHLKYRDQLVLTGAINDVGAPIRVNVPDSYRAGAELSGAVRLAPWLSIDGNATLSRNKISAFAEHIDDWDTWSQEVVERKNTDLALSPSFVAGQGFTFSALPHHKRMALDISLSTKCVGHQYLDNTSNPLTTLKPYAFSDAGIRLTWRPRFVKEIQLNFSALSLFVWADNMPGQRTLGDFLFGGSRKNAYMTNGWTYRFLSENYDPRPDDPYATAEGNGVYNLTGYFPQAGRQFLLGLKIKI
jgi:iron complex outermembrane receptor protein